MAIKGVKLPLCKIHRGPAAPRKCLREQGGCVMWPKNFRLCPLYNTSAQRVLPISAPLRPQFSQGYNQGLHDHHILSCLHPLLLKSILGAFQKFSILLMAASLYPALTSGGYCGGGGGARERRLQNPWGAYRYHPRSVLLPPHPMALLAWKKTFCSQRSTSVVPTIRLLSALTCPFE